MFPRTAVLARGHAEALSRSFSSSGRLWAGIAIGGGHTSHPDPPTPSSSSISRPSFARLRGEVEQSKQETPSSNADALAQESPSASASAPEVESASFAFRDDADTTPNESTAAAVPVAAELEEKTQQQQRSELPSNRRNPFSRRSNKVTDQAGGEGLGLRMKMAAESGSVSQRDSSLEYLEASPSPSAGIRDDNKPREEPVEQYSRQSSTPSRQRAEAWQPLTPGFEGAERAACKLPGYEYWTVLTRSGRTGKSSHLFARRIEGGAESSILTCFIALNAIFLDLRQTPRRIVFGDSTARDGTVTHFLQLEIGGHERREGGNQGAAGIFTAYPDFTEAEARLIQQIDPVLKAFSSLRQMRSRKASTGRREESLAGVSSSTQEASRTLADSHAPERGSRRADLQSSRDEQHGRTRSERNDAIPYTNARQDKRTSSGREGQWRPQEESPLRLKRDQRSTRQAAATKEKYVAPQRNSKEKQFEDLVATYQMPSARGFGILDRGVNSKREQQGSSSLPIGSSLPKESTQRDAAAETTEAGAKSGEKSSPPSSSSPSARVEDATPVAVDGQQAEGTAAGKSDIDSNPSSSQTSEAGRSGEETFSTIDSVPLEESTPIPSLDETAGGSVQSFGDGDGTNALSEAGANSVKEIKSLSGDDAESTIEDATPITIDGEQASGTAATSGSEGATSLAKKMQPKEGSDVAASATQKDANIEDSTPVAIPEKEEGRESSISTKEPSPDREDAVEEAVKEAPLGSHAGEEPRDTPVDGSTPVHVDGEQAQGTANATGSRDAVESAKKREEGQ